MKVWFLTVDTETVTKKGGNLVYNIAWAVHTKKGDIKQTRNYLVSEVWFDVALMKTAYYADKIPLYLKALKNKTVTVAKWNDIISQLAKDINSFGVEYLQAYNVEFDVKAIQSTEYYINGQKRQKSAIATLCELVRYPVEINCIYGIAAQTILNTISYKDWCKRNVLITDKGNIKCSAEVVYGYLINNPQYIEQHMALDDVFDEVYIYSRCRRNHKNIIRTPIVQAWRVVNYDSYNIKPSMAC